MKVFGDDYPTKDGTCIRDYVHVSDIANAHVLAYEYSLSARKNYDVFNLGYGDGVSVLEILKTFEKKNRVEIDYQIVDRREGDIVEIYSDSSKAYEVLGWKPIRTIKDMVTSAWKWHKNKI